MPEKCICIECGKEFNVKKSKKDTTKYCSRECMYRHRTGIPHGEWIESTCPSCGQPFINLKSKLKKYCSEECNRNRNEKYMMYNCDTCGDTMRIKKDLYQSLLEGKRKGIYCSKTCAHEAKKTGHNIVCEYCGVSFYRRQYHIDRQEKREQHNFCSLECQGKYKHEQMYETRFCEICGTEFECSKLSTQRFCSNKCNSEWQRTLLGENNPHFTSIKIPCDYCGTEHYVKQYKFEKQENFFCSEKCRQDWYADVYSQSDEWREECRTRIVKMLEDGVFSHTNSKPQQLVDSILDKNKIKYEREKSIKYYCVDNFLENNLIIEVQGDYWHCNPLKFSSIISQTQYDRIPKDKAKHTYTKNKFGTEILYIWESDTYNNLEKCEKLILEYIKRNGKLENYHSFNYYLDENKHLRLCDNIIIPYQDMELDEYKHLLKVS